MTTLGESQVSDSDIVREIGAVVSTVDLSSATVSGIREVVESRLGVELSHKKCFIREEIDRFLAENGSLGKLMKGDEDGEGEGIGEGGYVEKQEELAVKPVEAAAPVVVDQELEQFRENIEQAIEESNAPKEKKRRGGLNKLCRLSPELQAIIGEEALPRTQVVKQLWIYIRANNLQDPENKRNIICDDALRELFGQDSTDMFQMNKLLSKHIWSMNDDGGLEDAESKAKRQKKDSGKGKASGFQALSPISDALQKFLGTGESEVARTEVVRRMWDYIRSNQLQDPTDKKKILCDNKLQELFECDSFVGFSMTKLLASHFVKT